MRHRLLIPALLAVLLAGPSVGPRPLAAEEAAPAVRGVTPPLLDGSLGDWPDGAADLADGRHVFLRLAPPEQFTLQGGQKTSRLLLDLDADAATGRPRGDDFGLDLEIVFSPPGEGRGRATGPRAGVELLAYGSAQAEPLAVGHADAGFAFAPTFAAPQYEARLPRHTRLPDPVGARWHGASRLRWRFVVDGQEDAAAAARTVELPLRGDAPRAVVAALPARGDALRVVSWNVENRGPMDHPEPFARVLRALEPDVLLVQEWWRGTEDEIRAWLAANVPSPEPWRVHTFAETGVAVAARHPLTALTRERLLPAREVNGRRNPIRFVAARVDTPRGAVIAASLHLKAMGAMGTWEDELRQEEARSIQAFLAATSQEGGGAPVLVAGDYNLVGTDLPLGLIASGADHGGGDLVALDTIHLGDRVCHTWKDDAARFTPGRLDFALLSGAAAATARAFVFDGDELTEEALRAAGLERADSAASDHRPLVVDLGDARTARAAGAPPLEPLTGGELAARVRAMDGSVVIVNLWATWCRPCVEELPDFLRVAEELRDEGVRLILVSCDAEEDAEKARKLLGRLGVDFPTWRQAGPEGAFIDAVDPDWSGTLPATLLFRGDGAKISLHVGSRTYQELFEAARTALASSGGTPERKLDEGAAQDHERTESNR